MKVALFQAFNPSFRRARPLKSLAFGYLAAYAWQRVEDLQILVTEDLQKLLEWKPDLVGMAAYSMYFHLAMKAARKIKEVLGAPIILGGHHITAIPHTLQPEFDIGILREGEETFTELLKLYQSNGKFRQVDLKEVQGICYHDGETVVQTPPRLLIEPLDKIPFPDRELLNAGSEGNYAYLLTSRGCPFHCVFCSTTEHWQKFRAFSPEYVVKEIVEEVIEKYHEHSIAFSDDLFIANVKRCGRIFQLLKARYPVQDLVFGLTARANLVNEKLGEALKGMNVLVLSMGLESGSDRVLSYLKASQASEAINQRAMDLCRQAGVKVQGSFIVMSPPEERDDLLKTYDFIFRNRDVFSQVKILPLVPLPGTQVWEYAKSKGVVSEGPEMDWKLLQMGRINLNEKITKYEFYRFLQEYNKLVKKYGIDEAEAYENLFPLRTVLFPDEEIAMNIWDDDFAA